MPNIVSMPLKRGRGRPRKIRQQDGSGTTPSPLQPRPEDLKNALDTASRLVLGYQDDPVGFWAACGVTLTHHQRALLSALAQPNARVAVKSGHNTGKTAALAMALIWWLATRLDAKVPCTAPTAHQLHNVLWTEVRKWLDVLPQPLRASFTLTSERLVVNTLEHLNFAVPRTARRDQPEALQGFHAANLLFVIDEASGIDDVVFEVARGALSSPGSRIVMTSNPTRNSGYFYNAFHANRYLWRTLTFSSKDSPLCEPQYWQELANEFGEDTDIFRVRVLGEFPKAEPDQLIPLEYLEAACLNEAVQAYGPVVWGLDPAWCGESETALACRQGQVLHWVKATKHLDPMQVVGWVRNMYEFCPPEERPTVIVVDSIGLGAGVYARMRELGMPVIGVNVGKPSAMGQYHLIRDELWYRFREWLQEGNVRIVNDPKLIAQCTSIKILPPNSGGKLTVESKHSLRRRNLPSPDRADAVCLTFYYRRTVAEDQRFGPKDYQPRRSLSVFRQGGSNWAI